MNYLLSLFAFALFLSCSTQKTAKYSKIEYEVGPCFGFCPVYKITIDADRKTVLEAEHFNFSEGKSKDDFSKPREGTFASTISKEEFQKLISLTNNANVKSLKNQYEDKKIMDASKVFLRIEFFDGSKKEIKISAGEKPKKLETLYQYIEELKKNQTWTKVK